MDLRSRHIHKLQLKDKGGASWLVERFGYQLGRATALQLASPTEPMASMTDEEVGYRLNGTIDIKSGAKVGAYKSLRIGAAGSITGVDAAAAQTAAGSATSLGRIRSGGNPAFTVTPVEDHRFFPVYAGGSFLHEAMVVDMDQHATAAALNGLVDVAYERVDGTFTIVNNVRSRAQINPASENQMSVRLRLHQGFAGDFTDTDRIAAGLFCLQPADADFAEMHTLQLAVTALEGILTMLDGTTITIVEAGFTATPTFGQGAAIDGCVLNAVGYAATEGGVITISA